MLLFLLLFYVSIHSPFAMELDKRELYFDNLPEKFDGLTIFFCGDLHLRRWDYRIVWVQHQLIQAKADMILFSGDMVEESGMSKLEEFLEPLEAPVGLCFVPGNNENGLDDKERAFEMFKEAGFDVLINSSVRLADNLVVAGTDDPSRHHDDLDEALATCTNGRSADCYNRDDGDEAHGDGDDEGSKFTTGCYEIDGASDFIIGLTHTPELFPHCLENNIPLTLCGHTHGGQVRVPYFGALWVDTPRVKGRYDAGLFEEDGCQLLVTRGVGMSKLPMRCMCNPQVHLLTLRKR